MKTDNIVREIAAAVLELIDVEFDNSVDPFSNPWVPLKRPTHPILIDTGAMREGFSAHVIGDSFQISNSQDYFKYHNWGTQRIPQRMMVPDDVIPKKWEDKVQEIIERNLKADLEKK